MDQFRQELDTWHRSNFTRYSLPQKESLNCLAGNPDCQQEPDIWPHSKFEVLPTPPSPNSWPKENPHFFCPVQELPNIPNCTGLPGNTFTGQLIWRPCFRFRTWHLGTCSAILTFLNLADLSRITGVVRTVLETLGASFCIQVGVEANGASCAFAVSAFNKRGVMPGKAALEEITAQQHQLHLVKLDV